MGLGQRVPHRRLDHTAGTILVTVVIRAMEPRAAAEIEIEEIEAAELIDGGSLPRPRLGSAEEIA